MPGSRWKRRTVLGTALAVLAAALPAGRAAATDVRTVRVSGSPTALAVNDFAGTAYAGCADGSVYLIDGRTGQVGGAVQIGSTVTDLAVHGSAGRVYASNSRAGTVAVLDGWTGRVLTTIAAGAGAAAVGVDELTGAVYAGSSTTGAVSILDGVAGAVRQELAGPTGSLDGLSIDPGRRLAYFASPDTASVEVLDLSTGTFTGSIRVGKAPATVCVHRASNTIYVANSGIHHLSVLDGGTATETATILLDSAASAVAVHQRSGSVYSNGGPNGLIRIDGTRGTRSGELALGSNPGAVAVDQRTHTVYVADPVQHAVHLVTGF
ncbi:hypothetical protein ABZ863_00810 [Saccharomonospora sp. NPDC046836]|uniref:YncE family protein n=1 Tax=Saccharomonospora sp. NPDC046836 TaxID=3156921 RepID=UPI0033D6E818